MFGNREEIIVSWFATAGTLESIRTATQLTKTLDNVYTAPALTDGPLPPAVSIWMVARDQRGGTSWRHQEVRITP